MAGRRRLRSSDASYFSDASDALPLSRTEFTLDDLYALSGHAKPLLQSNDVARKLVRPPRWAYSVVDQRPRVVPSSRPGLVGLRYAAPKRVLLCVKRKIRKEVLFARNRAGYAGSARKRHWIRNAGSQYGC